MKLKNESLLKTGLFINNKWEALPKTFPVTNPANGAKIADIADGGEAETKAAIDAADAALKSWASKSAKERAAILRKWNDLILENLEDLAQLMTAEQGKPLNESRGEVKYGASFIEWFAEEGKRAYGETIPSTIPGARMLTIKQPVGVCAAITPWNFPNAMITRKVGPALAAGCTIVLKPPQETPLSSLALAELAVQAGIPAGVINIVPTRDSRTVGGVLCADDRVRKLSFTGSTEVGRVLMRQSADTIKKLSLELGGNAPFIVFDDADIDAAVAGAIICKFRNAGQTCVCANRLYVQEGIYDEFARKFTAKVKELKVGNGAEEGVEVGPLINEKAIDKVKELVDNATTHGAKIETGGKPHTLGGLFYEPTVITGMKPMMRMSCEEIFGPVAPLFPFKTEEEVLKLANATEYGLAAYFYTRDLARAFRVAEALESGMVAVNSPILSTEAAPFGGIKQSGIGREGSKYGIEDYLELKYILMGGL
ncbi:MAG: NAD-dependent succinate-semialdehyde dehydrogenase [Alphaproteobacteria bacterium]|nr:NAD-dependent succinate-semialdehyde dehydrogenase [Alphaproteobacteria bacterium]